MIPRAVDNPQEVNPLIQMVARFLTIGAVMIGTLAISYSLFHKQGDENIHGVKDYVLNYFEPLN